MMDMEPNQESTYEPLEASRRHRLESTDSPDIETSPPQDRNGNKITLSPQTGIFTFNPLLIHSIVISGILYIALIAAGIGFVLPYNR